MGIPVDVDFDFKSQFYNLQGFHINERKKNFYKLLKSLSPEIPQDQIDIQPRNYQETIFYVDVLIYFKKVEKLIDILREGIGILASKILKQQWFFEEVFKNMSEENIVNKFLPTLSYSIRMKVLKKLSLTLAEERMDKMFDLLLERYGLFIAKQFLFSCSQEKIVNILRNNEITLLPDQLKRILQKDYNLLKVYFEEFKKNTKRDFDDYNFLNYVIWKYPHLYYELGLNTRTNLVVSRCTTRTLIKTNRQAVLNDNIYDSKWHRAAIVREIKEFDKEYFFGLFPAYDINAIARESNIIEAFLIKYPIKKRWDLLSQTFKQAYNKEITDHLDKFDERLAKFFPQEIRQNWAEIKYLDSDNLAYIKYYNPRKAYKLLRDKINVTSDIDQRKIFLNELITVCWQNKDYVTYEAVLKYICIRHRNEDENTRAAMVSHIAEHIAYDCLTEGHWNYINEILDIQRLRDERLNFDIMSEYLFFVYSKNLPLDGPVRQYIEDCVKINRSFRLLPRWKEAERQILRHIFQLLPTLQLVNRSVTYCTIICNIIDFNKDLKHDQSLSKSFDRLSIDLNECAPIMDLIKEMLAKRQLYCKQDNVPCLSLMFYDYFYSKNPIKVIEEDILFDILEIYPKYRFEDFLLAIIKKPTRNSFDNKLLDYVFKNMKDRLSSSAKRNAIEHFLVREPEVIAKYFSLILPLDGEYGLLNYGNIKKYSHLGWDTRLITYYKDLLSVSNNYEAKINSLDVLSKIMTSRDFLDLVKDYLPDDKKLDLNNEEQCEKYKAQCNLAKFFKNLKEPLILAPVLMHFCQGSFLQSSLPALCKVLYRIDEENASSYINVLSKRGVSARKRAVYFGFELLPLKNSMILYSSLFNDDANISVKRYLFRAVLKYFFKNPLPSTVDLVCSNMNCIHKKHTKMIKTLVESVNKVTVKDRPVYIEKVWNFTDILEQQEVKVNTYRNSLLNTINNHGVSFILRLNNIFCVNTIQKYFLNGSDDELKLDCFVINYLLAYLDEQHFEFIFDIIKTRKDIHWKCKNMTNKAYILRFFTDAYARMDENDFIFLQLFNKCWQTIFNNEKDLAERILLTLMVLYKEHTNIEVFSKNVNTFFQELIGKFGPYISELLLSSVQKFYWNIPTPNNTRFNLELLLFHLLKSNPSELNYFIAFSIIRKCGRSGQETYSKVLDILKAVDVCTVRIYCNILLKKN